MNQLSQKTAILFFSNSVERESIKKGLLSGNKNREFLKVLRNKSLQTLKSTHFPIVECTEKDQRGETFGEKISNAFDDVFSKGYEQVICVGSDCPELSLEDINRAANAFNTSDIVLGPDFRGGLFLIGLNRKAFNKERIVALQWNQPDLVSSFMAYGISFNVHFLVAKFDLNFASDLLDYALVSTELQRLLKLVLIVETPQIVLDAYYYNNSLNSEYLRGPPHAA